MSNAKIIWKLFSIFFRIGAFTFGGGYAMLPLIQKEVVDREKWIPEDNILDIFAISQSVPGVIAINSAIFIGKRVGGFAGAVAAAAGVILPAFLSILLIILVLVNYQENIYVQKAFAGIRAASAALFLLAAVKLGKSALKNRTGYIIMLLSLISIILLSLHAMWAIVAGGVTGYLTYLYNRRNQKC